MGADERIPSRAPVLVSIRLGLKHRICRPAELSFPLGSVALRSENGQAALAGCQCPSTGVSSNSFQCHSHLQELAFHERVDVRKTMNLRIRSGFFGLGQWHLIDLQWSLKKFGSTGPHLLRPEKRWNLEEHIPDGFPVDELWALYYSS
jgi:hypothetical protein